MKGHVFISSDDTLRVVAATNTHAVFAEDRTKPQWRKTRADILADLSCLRISDRVFFYNTNDMAFHGIYAVVSEPYESNEDIGFSADAPYRVKLHKFLPLIKPITEHNLFTRGNAARDFRSIFFKKVLNRGKACTHLFPDETDALTKLMLMQNDIIPDEKPPSKIVEVEPLIPKFENRGGECSLEKELEWWITHHIGRHAECEKVFGSADGIEMFANYTPIDIAGSNIDLVVYHRKEIASMSVRNKISIVELKKGKAKPDALEELERYTRSFINNVIGFENADILQPIIIASSMADEIIYACRHWNLCVRKPRLFKYTAISDHDIKFDEMHYE